MFSVRCLATKNGTNFFLFNLEILFFFIMPPTLKKLMGHIAFGACVRGWVRAWVGVSHFLYLL